MCVCVHTCMRVCVCACLLACVYDRNRHCLYVCLCVQDAVCAVHLPQRARGTVTDHAQECSSLYDVRSDTHHAVCVCGCYETIPHHRHHRGGR